MNFLSAIQVAFSMEHPARLPALVFFLAASLNGYSQDNEIKLQFLTENAPPYSYAENGELKGLSIEILDAIFKEMHSDQTLNDVQILPWARAYKTVQVPGQMNVLFAATRIETREKLFKWVGPFATTTMSLWTSAKSGMKIAAGDELLLHTYAAVRDDTSDHLLKEKGVPESQIAEVPTFEQLPLMVRASRADFFAYNDIGARYHLLKMNVEAGEFVPVYLLSTGTLYLAFNKSVPDEIVERYQAALDRIKDKVTLIINKYTK